jgi:CPA2 family monovalent cation:H+ antiporter-2/glutathione-regulated potassium-efflux system protein KefB
MLMTPVGCLAHDVLAKRLQRRGVEPAAIEGFGDTRPTVLVIGFGRFGMMVSQILTSGEVEITALDNRADRVSYARKLGYKVFVGDATRPDVLKAAGADEAVLVALCIENDRVMGQAIDLVRSNFPKAKIFCRATDRAHALDLTRRGVDFQIRETFESSVTFGRAALDALGIANDRIVEIEEDVRRRDKERLDAQLRDGLMAGAEMLHQVTPRGSRSQASADEGRNDTGA